MNLFHYWHLVGVKNQRIGEIYFSALNSFTSSNPAGDVLGEVLRQTARCMEEIGEYEKANKIFHQSLYADTTMFGQWHEVVATDMYFLALTYIHLANYTSARNFARQAKDMRSNVLGPQHLDTADCINLLALICKKGADFATARELYKQALAIAQNTLGSLHGKLAEYLTNLGDVHRKLDEFVDAEKCYRRAHEITNVLYGPDSVQVRKTT
jgi:tetratricopeptide (TPR) repeat protein